MPLFRKKPFVILAEQFWPDRQWPRCVKHDPTLKKGNGFAHYIETLEGPMAVCRGDWVLTGAFSENYPVRRNIFEETYEPVKEST